MKTLKPLRKQLGFTQEDMARCLGIKRSMLVRAEEGRGDLPTAAYNRILHIYNYISMADNNIAEPGQEDLASSLENYLEAKREREYQVLKYQRMLKRLKKTRLALELSGFVLQLQEKNGEVVFPTWLAVARDNNQRKLRNCSLQKEAELEMRIRGLQAELVFLEEKIQECHDLLPLPAEDPVTEHIGFESESLAGKEAGKCADADTKAMKLIENEPVIPGGFKSFMTIPTHPRQLKYPRTNFLVRRKIIHKKFTGPNFEPGLFYGGAFSGIVDNRETAEIGKAGLPGP